MSWLSTRRNFLASVFAWLGITHAIPTTDAASAAAIPGHSDLAMQYDPASRTAQFYDDQGRLVRELTYDDQGRVIRQWVDCPPPVIIVTSYVVDDE